MAEVESAGGPSSTNGPQAEERAARLQGNTKWATRLPPLEHPENLRPQYERLAVADMLGKTFVAGHAPQDGVAQVNLAGPAAMMSAYRDELRQELVRGTAEAEVRVAEHHFGLLHYLKRHAPAQEAFADAVRTRREDAAAPDTAHASPSRAGEAGRTWAADRVDAVLGAKDRPTLVGPEQWTALNLAVEFGGRAIATGVHETVTARREGYQDRTSLIASHRARSEARVEESAGKAAERANESAREHLVWYAGFREPEPRADLASVQGFLPLKEAVKAPLNTTREQANSSRLPLDPGFAANLARTFTPESRVSSRGAGLGIKAEPEVG